jgi:hypothetical protein
MTVSLQYAASIATNVYFFQGEAWLPSQTSGADHSAAKLNPEPR